MAKELENENPEHENDEQEDGAPVAPPAPPKKVKTPTSADVVNSPLSKTIKSLETKISGLEDKLNSVEAKNTTYEEKLALLAKTPSTTAPGKSLLDQLEEWMGNPLDIFKK